MSAIYTLAQWPIYWFRFLLNKCWLQYDWEYWRPFWWRPRNFFDGLNTTVFEFVFFPGKMIFWISWKAFLSFGFFNFWFSEAVVSKPSKDLFGWFWSKSYFYVFFFWESLIYWPELLLQFNLAGRLSVVFMYVVWEFCCPQVFVADLLILLWRDGGSCLIFIFLILASLDGFDMFGRGWVSVKIFSAVTVLGGFWLFSRNFKLWFLFFWNEFWLFLK